MPEPPPWWDLERADAYRAWRDRTLAQELELEPVELADPARLRPAERAALLARLHAGGAARYRSAGELGPAGVLALGRQLGLARLDRHPAAGADGVARLTARADGAARYIPYTPARLGWHTDGYYRAGGRRVRAFLLHCARPARAGGGNRLLDPRRLYIALRDEDPELVRALAHPRAFEIPADAGGARRAACAGPVFAPDGERLYVRYTERRRHIRWRAGCAAARARVAALLAEPAGRALRLAAGEGLIAHNVLHCRDAYEDDPRAPRLLYRARYADYAEAPC